MKKICSLLLAFAMTLSLFSGAIVTQAEGTSVWDILEADCAAWTEKLSLSGGASGGAITQKDGYANITSNKAYTYLANTDILSPETEPFTFEVTARVAGAMNDARDRIAVRNSTGLYRIYLTYGTKDGGGNISSNLTDAVSIDTTIWHNYAAVVDPVEKTYDIYVDGEAVITGATPSTGGGQLFSAGADTGYRCDLDVQSVRIGTGDLADSLTVCEFEEPETDPDAIDWDILPNADLSAYTAAGFAASIGSGQGGSVTQKTGYTNIYRGDDKSNEIATSGSGGYTLLTKSVTLPASGPFTMEVTARLGGEVHGEGTNEISFRVGSQKKIYPLYLVWGAEGGIATKRDLSDLKPLDTTAWHNYALVIDPAASTHNVYVDGALLFTDAEPFSTDKNTNLLRLGTDTDSRCNLDVQSARMATGDVSGKLAAYDENAGGGGTLKPAL